MAILPKQLCRKAETFSSVCKSDYKMPTFRKLAITLKRFLWTLNMYFWNSRRKFFSSESRKSFAQKLKRRKRYFFLNWLSFSFYTSVHVEIALENHVQKISTDAQNFFNQCPKTSANKIFFPRKSFSLKLFSRTSRRNFWQSCRNSITTKSK